MFVIVILFIEVLWIKFVNFNICCICIICIGFFNLLFVFVYEFVLICLIINLIFWGDFLLVYSFFLGIDLIELII